MRQWERKATVIYSGTEWEKAALAAGKAMDNRLDQEVVGPYGHRSRSSTFDMPQWLAWFDYEVLVRRGLQDKAAIL